MATRSSKELRQIYDNIYGYINFSRKDFDFILKDPFFLRLHNLKQMGLAYYVYPDALHTRFAHSLGVYTNVCKIIDSQKRFGTPIKIESKEKYKIHLSALLHDIGHVPLSHAIEKALERFDIYEQESARQKSAESITLKPLLQENKNQGTAQGKTNIKEDQEKATTKVIEAKKHKVALHERLGEIVLNNCDIGKRLQALGISPLEIAAGFKGDIGDAFSEEHESSSRSFYNMQIRNFLHSQLDADRIDYLLRDASFSGVNTGSIDIDKLLNSIVYDNKDNYGIECSAIRALDQFFISRYVAYCQIVGNKKVMAFEYMANDFYYRLLKLRKEQKYHLGLRLYSFHDLVKDILPNNPDEFLTFTDDYFFSLVREVVANKESIKRQDQMVVTYAEMLTEGQPLLPVTYIEGFEDKLKGKDDICFIEFLYNQTLEESSEILNKIACDAGIDKLDIIIPEPMKITIYKDNEDPVQVFQDRTVIHKNISESPASLLWMLKNKRYCIYRIYTVNDNNKRESLRRALLTFVQKHDYKNSGDL